MKSRMKKWLSIAVSLLILCQLIVPMVIVAEGTEDFIPIRTIEELYNIRNNLTANYRLMNDIDLTDATAKGGAWDFNGNGWNPIGSDDRYSFTPFTGIFDGAGHKIIGMRIDVQSLPDGITGGLALGLFSEITGEIHDLHMVNSSITCKQSVGGSAGSIAGSSTAIISGCDNTGGDCNLSSAANAGGIVGYSEGSINNCHNTGNVFSKGSAGGIVGCSFGDISDCYNTGNVAVSLSGQTSYPCAGGIAGVVDDILAGGQSLTIANCHNTGNVDITSSSSTDIQTYAGGIIGQWRSSKDKKTPITNCYNTGDISSSATNGSSINSPYAKSYAGGIIGRSPVPVINCYNLGSVSSSAPHATATSCSGGIAGELQGDNSIRTCYSMGNTTSTLAEKSKKGMGIACLDGSASIYKSYYLNNSGQNSAGAVPLTASQMRLSSMYNEFDFDTIWQQDSLAEFPYPQLRSNPQNLEGYVELLRLISPPDKLAYLENDKLDLAGGKIEVLYTSGDSEQFDITPVMVSGFDMSQLGSQTVTVMYRGFTVTFEISVAVRPKVIGMELASPPAQTTFVKGTAFDFSGIQVNVVYDNGGTATLDVTSSMLSGGDINRLGEQTITISIDEQTTSFKVNVVPVEIDSLVLTTLPDKLAYREGEELDAAGLTLTAKYNNGTTKLITYGYKLSGYSSAPGTHTVTVLYSGLTVTFDVTVAEKAVISLAITQKPNKTEYIEGQSFDPTGLIVTATYDNGDIEEVTGYSLSDFDGTPGLKAIVVSYGGKTAAFSIKVLVRTVTKLDIVQNPNKTLYLEGESFDPAGLIVTATYNDGTTQPVTDYELVGFTPTPGIKSIAVLYGGKTAAFSVTVSAKTLDALRITYPDKLSYYIDEPFDPAGLIVTACYSNGQEIAVTDYSLSGFDSSTEGSKTIIVSYGGLTREFVVVVSARPIPDALYRVNNSIGRAGEQVTVTVSVEKNPGISGFRHDIVFDTSALRFVSAQKASRLDVGTLVVNEEQTSQGKVTLVWFNPTDFRGNDVLYTLTFEVLDGAEVGSHAVELNFSDNDNRNALGEQVLFLRENGSVIVVDYILGDVTGDKAIGTKDVVLLAQVVSGQSISLTESQKKAADVNQDGTVDIADVILLSQWLVEQE